VYTYRISSARENSLRKIEMEFEIMRERAVYPDHLKPWRPYEKNGQIIFLGKDLAIKKKYLPITSNKCHKF
jgi:hypothetical protein